MNKQVLDFCHNKENFYTVRDTRNKHLFTDTMFGDVIVFQNKNQVKQIARYSHVTNAALAFLKRQYAADYIDSIYNNNGLEGLKNLLSKSSIEIVHCIYDKVEKRITDIWTVPLC